MTEHANVPSPTSETLPSQTNDQLSELVKECLAKIEGYKLGPQLPLRKVQCITEITELLLETRITPHLTDSEINASLLSYTDIIDAVVWLRSSHKVVCTCLARIVEALCASCTMIIASHHSEFHA